MATSDYELVSPPDRDRARELWIQHAAGLPSGEMQQQYALDLSEGDGMCMGIHGWLESDFGKDPVAKPRSGG